MSWQDYFPGWFITQDYQQNGEPGIDISKPGGSLGSAVYAPIAGTVVTSQSTANELVVNTGQYWEDFMHIQPAVQQGPVQAGQLIGYVSNQDVTPDAHNVQIGWKRYSSTGPHLELGFYQPGTVPGDYQPSYDPKAVLANMIPTPTTTPVPTGTAQSGTTTSGLIPGTGTTTQPQPTNNSNGTSGSTPPIDNVPVVGGIWDAVTAPFSSIGNSANQIGTTFANTQQIGTNISNGLLELSKVFAPLIIILILAIAWGKAHHG